jgi:DNA-binding CsgD family transcriptional regulator
MQPGDVQEAAEIIAQHPVIGPRYGSAIADLPTAWLRILATEAATTFVLQAEEADDAPICGANVTVIVSDDFVREIKTPPLFWVGPELTKRILRGNSPLLSETQLRDANSRGGLNLLVWEGCPRHELEFDPEVFRCAMDAFIHMNLGYLWKEAISTQPESGGRLHWAMKTGGWFWDAAAGCYVESFNGDAEATVRKPHIVGVTRKDLLENSWSSAGSWVGRLFDYHPPLFGFSRGEQRVLALALSGATDEQLSARLNISLPAIKKTWISIYRRVADQMPDLVHNGFQSDMGAAARGREKRRDLLAYLREHPEELRPVSRKLL